jgi:nickel-dependent lactate racemase
MLYFAKGSENTAINSDELKDIIFKAFDLIGLRRNVLVIPPDFTRYHSKSGEITNLVFRYLNNKLKIIIPALGTHQPMSHEEISKMFGDIPLEIFKVHNWRNDIVTIGEVPSEFIQEISEDNVNYPINVQINKLLIKERFDLIVSVGQVIPHEVVGMANYNKNIFIGLGGYENIHKSHFLSAVHGMDRTIGRLDTPVRKVIDYAMERYLNYLPVIYILTVIGRDKKNNLVLRGIYIGDDYECFRLATELSRKVNIELFERPLRKVVVYLDPSEYQSTWLGNKSIYRTRLAIEKGGELIVIAPGLKKFGEDKKIDNLIRKYGYRSIDQTLKSVRVYDDLRQNLSAAAHLIHGSSEVKFKICYCPGSITKEEIENVGYRYSDIDSMIEKYKYDRLKNGFNFDANGDEFYFISNPALGLWACKEKFSWEKE